MWVLFIMPQRRKQAAQRHMLEALQVGDEIVTVGGIIGEVRELDEDEVLLEVAPGTTIRFARRAVAAIVPPIEDGEDAEAVSADGSDDAPSNPTPANLETRP